MNLGGEGSARDIAETPPADAWRGLSCEEGTKGARLHDWGYLKLADLDAGEYNSGLAGLWTRGPEPNFPPQIKSATVMLGIKR
jgi:SRSO17 transposase